MNISVLRTVFDKLGGQELMEGIRTPKRGWQLPVILSESEVAQVLGAAPTLRDQLLLGLMYGCLLKVGEACSLRWGDFDVAAGAVRVRGVRGARE